MTRCLRRQLQSEAVSALGGHLLPDGRPACRAKQADANTEMRDVANDKQSTTGEVDDECYAKKDWVCERLQQHS